MAATPTDKNRISPDGFNLPAYVLLRPEGVFINLSPPPARDILQLFVDRLFTSDARFVGLDYANFIRLLYNDTPPPPVGTKKELRIADKIVRFPQERMALYKGVKILDHGERAEYMFEPTFLETVTEEPVYGEPGEDGIRPVVDHLRNVKRQPAQLDFDEFVTSMWLKGVRFGIDADVVREAIQNGKPARMDIAFHQPPTDSKDAEVMEKDDTLRQNNAPLILPNGKADLRRARNRFPQVAKDALLLRKIPGREGKPGYLVSGAPVAPRSPEDIDMNKIAGEGTRLEQGPKGEFLMAAMDGFVVIDESTGQITITAKIENKGGISAKSTGDLQLDVDEFTEHGEVQEGRVVEGKHMTFLSDVFGDVTAKEGDLELARNLSGGRAQSIGGNVTVKGRAINAVLIAQDGTISTEIAEGCLIMGKRVSIKRAVNCEIVAEELQLGESEGCGIAGKAIQIASSDMRKHRETIISMLLPDFAAYDKQIAEAKENLAKIQTVIQAKNREIAATQSDPGFARYLVMAEKIRSGAIKFSPEQEAGWKKIVNQFAPLVRGTDGLVQKCMVLEDAIKQLTQERDAADVNIQCKIDEVRGDTVVRKVSSNLGLSFFREQPEDELRINLHQLGDANERILSNDRGTLDWHFTPPKAYESPA